MIRLVHPAPVGQDPPKRRKGHHAPALSLTDEEARRVRVALKNLRRSFGSWACLATAMGVPEDTLTSVAYERKHRPTGTFAVRLAKAAGVSVESVLAGTIASVETCPTCGHRPGTGRLAAPAKSEEPRPWPTGGGVA